MTGREEDGSEGIDALAAARAAGIPVCWMRRPSNEVDVACIYETDAGWRVSTTDERATEESIREYSDRTAAIEDFVNRVEGFVRYRELRERLLAQRER